MRKSAIAMLAAVLFGATAVCLAASPVAGVAAAAAPASATGPNFICNYQQCVTTVGATEDAEVDWEQHTIYNPLQQWNVVNKGTVTGSWPFRLGLGLNDLMAGDQVVEIQVENTPYWAVGTCDYDTAQACMKPAGNNFQVLVPLGGNNYEIVNVHYSSATGYPQAWTHDDSGAKQLSFDDEGGYTITLTTVTE